MEEPKVKLLGNHKKPWGVGYWYVGDKAVRVQHGRRTQAGKVMGYAIGKDGQECLLLDTGGTYLCPVTEAQPLESVEEVLEEFAGMVDEHGLVDEVIADCAERIRLAVKYGA